MCLIYSLIVLCNTDSILSLYFRFISDVKGDSKRMKKHALGLWEASEALWGVFKGWGNLHTMSQPRTRPGVCRIDGVREFKKDLSVELEIL